MRLPKGAGMVEGVVGLCLVIGGLVIAMVVLVNVGTATYLKNKVAFVAEQIARYAASEADSTKRSNFNQDLITKMGLSPGNTQVHMENTQLGDQAAVKATVSTSSNLLLKLEFLPETISMSDSAIAASSAGFNVEGYLLAPAGPGNSWMQQGSPCIPLVKLPAPAPLGGGIPGYAPMFAGAPPYGFQIVTVMNLQR